MRLKIQCTANPHILQYTVVDTLVGTRREIPEMNFKLGRLGGWLEGEARRSILRKVRAEARGPATRCENRSLQDSKWCVTETANFKNDQPDDEPVDLRQSRKRLSGRKCCSQREPNAKPSLFADLEPSEPDDRPVDRPVDRPTLLMFNTLKTL